LDILPDKSRLLGRHRKKDHGDNTAKNETTGGHGYFSTLSAAGGTYAAAHRVLVSSFGFFSDSTL